MHLNYVWPFLFCQGFIEHNIIVWKISFALKVFDYFQSSDQSQLRIAWLYCALWLVESLESSAFIKLTVKQNNLQNSVNGLGFKLAYSFHTDWYTCSFSYISFSKFMIWGIGSTKTKLHQVQQRIADAHGSQCGFCTPGIVMSMYTLLRNDPNPMMEDIETYFQVRQLLTYSAISI